MAEFGWIRRLANDRPLRATQRIDAMFEFGLIADASNLLAARLQMAFTLGFHIVLACMGVGMPLLMLIAEFKSLRGDPIWREIAIRWSRAFAVMFAVGAVSGTVLSFELGLLWPVFMGRWGAVIGLPFTLEGFAFFIEAIFAGIYLYGWNRLSPLVHWLTGIPIALAGVASAWFVVTANAWMNSPQGFSLRGDQIVDIDPIAAMLNPATGAQTTHMIIAAFLVSGLLVAGYYACRILRGDRTEYARRAMRIGLAVGVLSAPLQVVVGDWSAKVVARTQPVKFAAMEAHFHTQRGAALYIGGIPNESSGEVNYALRIPRGLSLLAAGELDAEVVGLNDFPKDLRPPVLIVHLAFQVMVGIGTLLVVLSGWVLLRLVRRRSLTEGRFFLICVSIAGPLSVIAMEAGWVVTEVGRQPWVVQGYTRTSEAVTQTPGLWIMFGLTVLIYSILLLGLVFTLRLLAARPLQHELN